MPGRIVHFELVAADADRASGFWNGLFGWSIAGSAMEGFDYRMFDLGDGQGGAIYPAQEGSRQARRSSTSTPTTSTRRSRRCASSAARRTTSSRCRRTAGSRGCNDTEGNAFSLWQGDENAGLSGLAVALAVLGGLAGSVQVAVMGRFGGARRRARGARFLHRRSSSPVSLRRARAVRGGGIGGLRHVGSTPAWMWIGGLMGLHRRHVDHVRAAADRRDRGDRDPDRRAARDGRGDRPLRAVRRRPDRHLAGRAPLGIVLLGIGAALSLVR